MRLLFIANANSIHARRWIDPFVQRGDEVHVLSYMRVARDWPGVILTDLTQLPGPPRGKLYHWAYWLRGHLRRTRPHILHAHQVTIAGWLGALSGFHPFIISAWGSDLLIEPERSPWRRWKTRFALQRSDAVTAPSPLLADAAIRLGMSRAKVRLIPWGVETAIFSPEPDDRRATRRQLGIPADAWVILSPRGVKAIYHHDILIRAVAQLPPVQAPIELCFLDFNPDPAYKRELLQLIDHLGMTPRVHWLPPQPGMAHMARLYRMADIVVSIPSSEGYGFTVYEALACGTPALITDLPIFEGVLEHERHVLKTPVRDVEQTAAALHRLMTDAPLRDRLRGQGLALSRRFSVQQRVRAASALYDELRP